MTSVNIRKLKIGIAVAYVLAYGLVFFYDVPQNPELARLKDGLPKVDAAQNRYFAMIGIDASSGSDIHKAGVEKITALREQFATGQKAEQTQDQQKLALKGKLPQLYDKPGNDLRSFVTKYPDRVTVLVADNRELVQRYYSLRQYGAVAEPLELGFLMPVLRVGAVRNAQQLEYLRLLQGGSIAASLAFVQEDLLFWRKHASQTRVLIDKLTAISCIIRDYQFVSELAASKNLTGSEWQSLEEILRPQPLTDVDMTSALAGELLMATASMAAIHEGRLPDNNGFHRLTRFVLKPGLTGNELYQNYLADAKLASLASLDFARGYNSDSRRNSGVKTGMPLLSWLVNPIGQDFILKQSTQYPQYIDRQYRPEGQRRLALLRASIARLNISDSAIPAYLAKSGSELANPFTGKPMEWDSVSRKLFYTKPTQGGTVDCYL